MARCRFLVHTQARWVPDMAVHVTIASRRNRIHTYTHTPPAYYVHTERQSPGCNPDRPDGHVTHGGQRAGSGGGEAKVSQWPASLLIASCAAAATFGDPASQKGTRAAVGGVEWHWLDAAFLE